MLLVRRDVVHVNESPPTLAVLPEPDAVEAVERSDPDEPRRVRARHPDVDRATFEVGGMPRAADALVVLGTASARGHDHRPAESDSEPLKLLDEGRRRKEAASAAAAELGFGEVRGEAT